MSAAARRTKGAFQAASRARQLRTRRPPSLAVATGRTRAPMIFYLAPDLATPSGGTRSIYRHVDLLNASGVEATVVHARRGFRCDWFQNATRVLAAAEATLEPDDLLVVPEWYGVGFQQLPATVRKVIFNQGPYHTFDLIPYERTAPGEPYTTLPGLTAILTVSTDGARLLRYALPTIPVSQVRPVVDGARFRPASQPAGARIGFMPRRRPHELEQLLHILRSRGALEGWELVPIDGRTEQETAELMRTCVLFLSFSEREGFGLPPAEAMACGCYVVGFTGLGGRDYFDRDYCSPVPESDLLAYVRAVESALREYRESPETLLGKGQAASARILGYYHEAGLRADLTGFYDPLLRGEEPALTTAEPVE